MPSHLRDLAGDQPGAARDVQDLGPRPDVRGLDQEPVDSRIVAGVHFRERGRLPRELVQDQLPLPVHRNLRCIPAKTGVAGGGFTLVSENLAHRKVLTTRQQTKLALRSSKAAPLPHGFCGLASRKSFTIGMITDLRSISVTCVVLGRMANRDAERGRMSP